MSMIRKYHNHKPQTKFIQEWRVKLEGELSWIPAKLIDQKPFVVGELMDPRTPTSR